MANVQGVIDTIKKFVIRYRNLLLCVGIGLVLLMIGLSIKGKADEKVEAANRQLSDVLNTINGYELSLQNNKVVVDTNDDEVDFKKDRYTSDLKYLADYLSLCFNFANYDEYENNRSVLINRLGADHELFKTFLTDYKPEYSSQMDETALVNDGKAISCHISGKSIAPSLYKIDHSTNINSYTATLSCDIVCPKKYEGYFKQYSSGNTSQSIQIIVTCDIAEDGTVTNFKAYPVC